MVAALETSLRRGGAGRHLLLVLPIRFNSLVAAFPREVAVARLLGGQIEPEHPHGAGALDLPALSPRQ
jgi:hypothetical protein